MDANPNINNRLVLRNVFHLREFKREGKLVAASADFSIAPFFAGELLSYFPQSFVTANAECAQSDASAYRICDKVKDYERAIALATIFLQPTMDEFEVDDQLPYRAMVHKSHYPDGFVESFLSVYGLLVEYFFAVKTKAFADLTTYWHPLEIRNLWRMSKSDKALANLQFLSNYFASYRQT